jgi:signal transduction histidine kinase
MSPQLVSDFILLIFYGQTQGKFLKKLTAQDLLRLYSNGKFLTIALILPYVLLLLSSIFLLTQFRQQSEKTILILTDELQGAKQIYQIANDFEPAKKIGVDRVEIIKIANEFQISLDSHLDTYYLGLISTRILPKIIENSIKSANMSVSAELFEDLNLSKQNIKPICDKRCPEIQELIQKLIVNLDQISHSTSATALKEIWILSIQALMKKVSYNIEVEIKYFNFCIQFFFFLVGISLIVAIILTYKVYTSAKKDIELLEEHKRTLQQLEEAQKLAKVGSWEFNLITQEQTWSNEHYNIFEIPKPQPQNVLYQMYRDRIHPEDLVTLDKYLEKSLKTGEGFVFDHRVFLDNGTRMKYVQGIGKVHRDSDGKPYLVSGTCQDITSRVHKDKVDQIILDSLGLGIWQYNPQTQQLTWDKSLYKLYEIDPTDFNGHYEAWSSALTPEARTKAVSDLENALSGNKEFNTTFEILTKNNQRKFIGGKAQVIRNENGKPIMMYGINWDRTTEIELEKKIELERSKSFHNAKLASLGELAAGIAHEINNPLAVIIGNIALLNKSNINSDKLTDKLAVIEKSATRISKIVRGLSKFARMPDGQMKSELISNIINDVLMITDTKAKNQTTPIEIDIRSNSKIICEPIEIEQVFVNLINNALDAARNSSKPWVKVTAYDDVDHVVIQISDSGLGIPKEIESKLFQPFVTTKAVGEGTGLGLSISKAILDQHKSSITVLKETLNTCFEIRIPIEKK